MNKKLEAPNKKLGAPTQTLTSSDNRHNRHNCQGETEEPLLFTLPNNQIGDSDKLRLTIGHSDHKLKQVWRNETHVVYKHFGSHGQFIGWEAIKIKKEKARMAFGKYYPNREVYPGAEDFGTYALSVGAQYDLEYAIKKAKTLKCRRENRQTNLEQLRRRTGPETNHKLEYKQEHKLKT